MRTTLTIDDDVAAKLEAEARRSGRTWRATVNETLRLGLLKATDGPTAEPFVVRARPLRLRPGLSYDNIEELLDQADGSLRR